MRTTSAIRMAGRTRLSMASRQLQRRWNSSPAGPGPQKEVNPHRQFYKTFTRPIAKVLLMATFTYQLAYWAWVKLETDEVKAGKTAEVKVLETQLEKLTNKEVPKP